MKKNQEYITFLTPEFIYIPFDREDLLKIDKSRRIYHDGYLGMRSNNDKIFCPCSGYVLGMRKSSYNGYESNSLVIENDFMDVRVKLNPSKSINKIKKSEVIESLAKYGLNKKINSKTTLVVNSLYDKKYDLKDMVINCEYYEEILEAIDEFMEIFGLKVAYINVDRNDLYSINAYEKYINAFLNICLVHSNKKFKDSSTVFYSVDEILAIHKAIHLDYMYDNTVITINNGTPHIVKVKLYTSLSELLQALKITYKTKTVLVNNIEVDASSFVIDSSVRSVIIKDK